MARVKGPYKISGSVGDNTFYSLPGSDQVYMRQKGGPSRRQVKNGDNFALFREHQNEWAACVLFSRSIDSLTNRLKKLGDYNVSPVWNGIGKKLIKLDTDHLIGQRWLQLSKYPMALQGFDMNKNFQFNALFKGLLQCNIDKQEQSLLLKIPCLNTANDLFNPRKLPYFRLKFAFALFADIYYDTEAKVNPYQFFMERAGRFSCSYETAWLSTNDLIPAHEELFKLELKIPEEMKPNFCYLFCAGIEYATLGFGNQIEAVKNASAAKILIVDNATEK